MREPDTFKRLFVRSLLITFLVCRAGVAIAGKGDEAAIPEQLQEILESLDYKVVKCKPLEDGRFCHSSSIVRSMQIYDREHDSIEIHGARLMTLLMLRLPEQPPVISRFQDIDPQSWDSPHAQAAAVSDMLVKQLMMKFALQREQLIASLERISNHGYHSILLTAINTLEPIRQNAEQVARLPIELINDLRLDMDQFESLEVAILLSMASAESTLVLDGSDPSGVRLVSMGYVNPVNSLDAGIVNIPEFEITIRYYRELSQQSVEDMLNAASFRFVVSPEYGLLPLQPLNVSVQEEPALVAGTPISPASCSSNECPATCYDTRAGDFRSMGLSDEKPVKSRVTPKLKEGLPEESVKDKWERYSNNRFRHFTSLYKVTATLLVSSFGYLLHQNERIRAYLYQSVCGGVDDIGQCGLYYVHLAENAGKDFRTAVYSRTCGNLNWPECQQYYMDNYIPGGR